MRSGSALSRIGLLPEGVVLVPAASPGLSCTAVCAGHEAEGSSGSGSGGGFSCSATLLPIINTCESLRGHFRCSFCQDSVGGDQPAYVSITAPQDKLPGACLVNKDASLFGCEDSWQYTHRLCPCVSAAG